MIKKARSSKLDQITPFSGLIKGKQNEYIQIHYTKTVNPVKDQNCKMKANDVN